MANLDIKRNIEQLKGEFDINFSTLKERNDQIVVEILRLQEQCTHKNEHGEYVLTANKTCEYCGKVMA